MCGVRVIFSDLVVVLSVVVILGDVGDNTGQVDQALQPVDQEHGGADVVETNADVNIDSSPWQMVDTNPTNTGQPGQLGHGSW